MCSPRFSHSDNGAGAGPVQDGSGPASDGPGPAQNDSGPAQNGPGPAQNDSGPAQNDSGPATGAVAGPEHFARGAQRRMPRREMSER